MQTRCLNCQAQADREPGPFWVWATPACPTCGTHVVPGRDNDDVAVSLRWQELRLLVGMAMAADGYPDDARNVLQALTQRLSAFRPNGDPPLTAPQLVHELKSMGVDAPLSDGEKLWPVWPPEGEPSRE